MTTNAQRLDEATTEAKIYQRATLDAQKATRKVEKRVAELEAELESARNEISYLSKDNIRLRGEVAEGEAALVGQKEESRLELDRLRQRAIGKRGYKWAKKSGLIDY